MASGSWALPAAVSAVPGSGAAAGALASGGSEDRVYGQPAWMGRSGAVCAGEGHRQKVRPESLIPHAVPAGVARPCRCLTRATRAPVPTLCLAPARPGAYTAPLHSLWAFASTLVPVRRAGRAVCWAGGAVAVRVQVLCSPRPVLFPLRQLWLVKPQLPSSESLASHPSPTYRMLNAPKALPIIFASA